VHPVLFHIGAIVIPTSGAVTALGVLLGLWLALRTARIARVDANHLWTLCIIALFAAIAGSRLLLIALNWTMVRTHPAWLLSLAMVHHPLTATVSGLLALIVGVPYALSQRMPLLSTADALAPPLALALCCEQVGALLAAAGYGSETSVPWAIVYTNPLASRWSGAPQFVPVHPVQLYAALAFLIIAVALVLLFPQRRQHGDICALGLIGAGTAIYITEFFRDPEGRGSVFRGALDGPQVAAILLVLLGAFVAREHKSAQIPSSAPSRRDDATAEASHD
jgi:phosphatidylglycerol:prolipoprotein diacylglycerol transferase